MPSSRIVCGRLLELDLGAGFRTVDELKTFSEGLEALIRQAPHGARLVVVTDMRDYQLSGPDVAEAMAFTLRKTSPSVERNAFLHEARYPTAMLQLLRLIHESVNPNRKLFSEPGALLEWLDPVLGKAERERLRAFLLDREHG